MRRFVLALTIIGWNICSAAANSRTLPPPEGGGNSDPLTSLSQNELYERLDSLVAKRPEAIRLKLHRIETYREDLRSSRTWRDRYAAALHLYREFNKGSYIPPDPKPGGYNLCL